MDLHKPNNFEEACECARNLECSNFSRLELYGLYKQSLEGDAKENHKPMPWNITSTSKFNAWSSRCGVSSEAAKDLYLKLVCRLIEENDSSQASHVDMGGMGKRVSMPKEVEQMEKPAGDFPGDMLLYAATTGNLSLLNTTLASHPECIQYSDENKTTALHFACDRGFVDTCVRLLEAGADVNAVDDEGISVLETAESIEREDIVKILLKYDAKAT